MPASPASRAGSFLLLLTHREVPGLSPLPLHLPVCDLGGFNLGAPLRQCSGRLSPETGRPGWLRGGPCGQKSGEQRDTAHPGWGGGGGRRQKGLFLSLRADEGPEEVPGLDIPQGALGPNRSATRMGGYASVQGEVREGQIALPAGTGPPLGAAASLGEGGAGLVGSRVGVQWGMVGRRQRVRMEGEPLEQGDQTGNVVLPAAAGGGEGLWRQDREPGRRVLRCARREMGAGPWGASGGVA